MFMVNKIQKKVIKHVKKTNLNKKINEYQINPQVLKKLFFIRFLYNGETVEKACELQEISLSTGHRWLDRWNESGYEGLLPKYGNCGRKSKLTDDQFKKLDEIMVNESFLSSRKVHEIIKEEFNIDYSMSVIPKIVKKLGYSYKKGYIIYSKMPEDAEIELKKN
jgi:transposase